MLNNSALPLDEMVKNYNKYLSITLDNHAPIICKIITVRKNALWYDNTLLGDTRLKRKLERKWRETKSISDYREYRNQSIAVNKNLETARIKHYNNEICQQQGNSKVMFSVAKKLTGDSIVTQYFHTTLTRLPWLTASVQFSMIRFRPSKQI